MKKCFPEGKATEWTRNLKEIFWENPKESKNKLLEMISGLVRNGLQKSIIKNIIYLQPKSIGYLGINSTKI